MLTRALAQNLAIIGMLFELQGIRRTECWCDGWTGPCGCGEGIKLRVDDMLGDLGEQQWGDEESPTHKEIHGQ